MYVSALKTDMKLYKVHSSDAMASLLSPWSMQAPTCRTAQYRPLPVIDSCCCSGRQQKGRQGVNSVYLDGCWLRWLLTCELHTRNMFHVLSWPA